MDNVKQKLTDMQLRVLQVIAGLLSAAALVISIYISGRISDENFILQYLFLIVFLVVMFGRRQIEKKYRLRLNLFSLTLIDGIIVGVIIYAALAFWPASAEDSSIQLDETLKVIIIVGVALLTLVLGVLLPLKRYFRRKEEGTLPPIRIPEPDEKQDENTNEETEDDNGPMSIEQQIRAMTKELDDKNDEQPK